MGDGVSFANPWSRVLLKRFFDEQFVLPEKPPKLIEWPLKGLERLLLAGKPYRKVELKKPIFIISLPRTGSTMLQNVLCTHPQLAYVNNTMSMVRTAYVGAEFARRWLKLDVTGERYLADSVIVDTRSPSDAVAFWTDWFNVDPYSCQYQHRRLGDFPPEHIDYVLDEMRKIVWLNGGSNKRFFTKNPGLLTEVEILHEAFPDAKFIHLLRDPRNNANSMVKLEQLDNEQLDRIRAARKGHDRADAREFVPFPRLPRLKEYVDQWGLADIRTTARIWNDAYEFVDQRRPGINHFHQVRYEDIVANPAREISRIFEFCELDGSNVGNPEYQRLLSGIGKTHHVNRYGNFDLIEDLCRDNMQRLGYR